jgi:hypothetical protein
MCACKRSDARDVDVSYKGRMQEQDQLLKQNEQRYNTTLSKFRDMQAATRNESASEMLARIEEEARRMRAAVETSLPQVLSQFGLF